MRGVKKASLFGLALLSLGHLTGLMGTFYVLGVAVLSLGLLLAEWLHGRGRRRRRLLVSAKRVF